MAAYAALAALFIKIADEVVEGETRRFDQGILLSLRQPNDLAQPIGPAWVQLAVRDLTSLGSTTVLSLMTVLAISYLLLQGKPKIATAVFVSIAGGTLISTLLKDAFARPRPDIVAHLVDVSSLSFPSGHAMMSAVTYLTLGALLASAHRDGKTRTFILVAAVLLTVLVGVSRVYLGVHYPTDVLAGWSAGASWAIACWLVTRRLIGGSEPSRVEG